MVAAYLLSAMLAAFPATGAMAPPPIISTAPDRSAQTLPLATPQFRRYGLEDGLPGSVVNAIEQDRSGYLWFGVMGGLARYDGVEFKVFRNDAGDVDSLGTNDITQLQAGENGKLWIGTGGDGLDEYDPASGHFIHHTHSDGDPASLSNNNVWALAQGPDGSLWVGTGAGLDRLKLGAKGFEHIANPLSSSPDHAFKDMRALLAEADGKLWIGTKHELWLRQPDGRISRVPVVTDARIQQQFAIWRIEGGGTDVRIGIRDGLLRVDADGVARQMPVSSMQPGYVFSSTRDRNGQLWMGTLKGLLLDDGHGELRSIHSQRWMLGGFPGRWVWRVLGDREGGLWFALRDGGIAYLAPGWNSFSRFTHIPDDPDSLRGNMVSSVAPAMDGKLWVGGDGTVEKLDPLSGHVEHVLDNLGNEVIGLLETPQGLWIIRRGVLYRYAAGELKKVSLSGVDKAPLCMTLGTDGRIYVAVGHIGVYAVQPDTLAASLLPMTPEANDDALMPSQLKVHDGVLWDVSPGGLLRWDAQRGQMRFVDGMPHKFVGAIAFDPAGFWATDSDKLMHYHMQGDRAVQDRLVGAQQGWPSLVAQDMQPDGHGGLWLFALTGLWRFDIAKGSFHQFGLQDGLANGEFNGNAASVDGLIYAPSQGGVVGFSPERISDRPAPPSNLAIVGASVRNRDGDFIALPPGDTIRLGWKDRELRVEARLFSYIEPKANHYRFFLQGFDKQWVDTGSRGDREFTNLGSGDYSLQVMATGANSSWVTLTEPLHVQVEAPPWARWWAWLGYALLLGLLVWSALLAWRRRLASRHRIQLAEQKRVMAEQASAAKTQFLATLSHEIRTPMTGVIGMAELLLATPLTPVQHEYTEAVQRSGDLLLKLLNDALDLARIESGRLELEPAAFEPRRLIDDVVRLERARAQGKGLALEWHVAEAVPRQLMGDAMRIKQILLNLVSNALKFTEHGGVTLRAEWEDEQLRVSVSDTGPGIPEASQTRLFQRFEQDDGPQRRAGSGLGLAICRELVGLMGGSIELASRLGQGSTFCVRLPLAVVEASPAMPGGREKEGDTRTLELLLVEDDSIVAAVIRGLLEQQGHRVTHALNGLNALAELAQQRYDAVLLDLDLPGVDGFQIARLIRQGEGGARRMPIIAVTARSGGDEEARAREAGMDNFLRKPLTGAQLARALASAAGAEAVVV